MDIDVSLVEDSRRLAKQCKMKDLIEELENKCKKVYEFGETLFNNDSAIFFNMHISTAKDRNYSDP